MKPMMMVMMKMLTYWDPYPHISAAITHPAKPRRLAAPVYCSDHPDDDKYTQYKLYKHTANIQTALAEGSSHKAWSQFIDIFMPILLSSFAKGTFVFSAGVFVFSTGVFVFSTSVFVFSVCVFVFSRGVFVFEAMKAWVSGAASAYFSLKCLCSWTLLCQGWASLL